MATTSLTRSNQIALIDSVAADQLADDLAGAIVTDEGPPALPALPDAEQRELLHVRQTELQRQLRACNMANADMQKLADALTLWFVGYPSMRKADAQVLVTVYVKDLMDLPLYAIVQALDDIKKGRVKDTDKHGREVPLDPDFAPTSARIHKVAENIAARERAKHYQIDRILKVRRVLTPLPSPEVQERLRQNLADLGLALKVTQELELQTIKDKVAKAHDGHRDRAILTEYQALGVEPKRTKTGVLISPSLARQLGRLG